MLPRLASSGTPAIHQRRAFGAAPPRARLEHTRAPRTRQRRAHPPAGNPEHPAGRGRRAPSSPAPRRESTPTKKVRTENEGMRQSPKTLFQGAGWGVANSSQMSSGAEAQGLPCFQSLISPALPFFFSSAWSCPGRRSHCGSFPGRRGGNRDGRAGGGGGGGLCADPFPARRCRGPARVPRPRLARVAIGAPVVEE